ncbi:MAG: substrate-binding domain-containing protein [Clostridium sp.]|nr:substrate-binding domain-containing protein [Clostridium sp.]
MTRSEKIIWGLFGGALVLLFLLSSTDLIIKEKKAEIYPVSVIINHTNDEYFQNYKKGMEQAAREYNADVRFITMYEAGSGAGQMELAEREAREGAAAIILAPARAYGDGWELETLAYACPFILLGPQVEEDLPVCSISVDERAAGAMLGKAIAEQPGSASTVYVFTQGIGRGACRQVYGGLVSALREEGCQVLLCDKEEGQDFGSKLEELIYPGSGKITAAALDIESLTELSGIIGGRSGYPEHVAGLYGVGSSTYVLNQMDKGLIKGVVAYSSYDEGYLSIKQAVEAARQGAKKESITLEAFYIEKEDIHSSKFEKMLYPMD